MLNVEDLKDWLFRDLTRLEKILLILSTSDVAQTVAQIKETATFVGFRDVKNKKWNVSQILGASAGEAIRTGAGWEVTESGRMHLRKLGVSKISAAVRQVASDLRAHLERIADLETRNFVEEAIRCHESELYRSAIVMSWLGAMDVLHKHVHSQHLAAFNSEARRVNDKWKAATTPDDLMFRV